MYEPEWMQVSWNIVGMLEDNIKMNSEEIAYAAVG
jgi:hypothetical protein